MARMRPPSMFCIKVLPNSTNSLDCNGFAANCGSDVNELSFNPTVFAANAPDADTPRSRVVRAL